ncbi:MAG: hypothetical protein COW01_00090 [Bdellovibrionales bacterium CG12_big_fil_rev_8_21_14_0_65_38_15]|nr:MAG: hypothetical protein COW01_00090 [Bdellovibrionales bacterium CG12_big_fil_rev_8_21_14_0_65_38_15]
MVKIILLLFFITSCASSRFERSTAPQNDSFLVETTIRFDGKRLNDWAQDNGVLGEATKLCQSGESDKGQQLLKDNLSTFRKDSSYWMVVGNCHWYGNDSAKAEYFYRLALGLGKSSKVTQAIHNNLGLLYMQRQLYPEARSELSKADQSLTAKYNLAQIELLMGNSRGAKSLLAELYRNNRQDPDVLASLAVAHLLDGNNKVALKVLSEVPEIENNRQDISFYKAMGFYLSGNVEKAEEQLNKVDKANETISRLSDMAKKLEQLVQEEVQRREDAAKAAQEAAEAKQASTQG